MMGLNANQLYAIGLHIASYAAGAITTAAAFHFLSGADAQTLTTSLADISNGVASIAAGVGSIIMLVSGWYAAWSASHGSQLAAVQSAVDQGSLPGVKITQTSTAGVK